ncbi:MAG: hypothetical protein ABIE94_03355 [archaeon]
MNKLMIILLVVAVLFVVGCVCVQDGYKCCKGEECRETAIDCSAEARAVYKGCTATCDPDWECVPFDDTPPGDNKCDLACKEAGYPGGDCSGVPVIPEPCEVTMNKVTLRSGNRQLCEPPDVPDDWVGAGVACCCEDDVDSCVQDGYKCCIGDDCRETAIDCSAELRAVFRGCTDDCDADWTCVPIKDKSCESDADCKVVGGVGCGCGCYNNDYVVDTSLACACSEPWACECRNNVCSPKPWVDESFKNCASGLEWGCGGVTTGADPGEDMIPEVCGCIPECPGQFLIAQAISSSWPDGSQKGSFFCADELPP